MDYEIVELPGLSEMVWSRETNGIVTLTFPTTLPADQMAAILNSLGLGCQCKAAIGTRAGFFYGSVYEILDTRQVFNKASVVAWFHRSDDSAQAKALRADLARHLTLQTSPQ